MNQMNTHLHQKFYTDIYNFVKSNQFDSILVAISGGQDSLCLIKLMQDLKKIYMPLLKIDYIYIDHQWKKDSEKQIRHLINFIKKQKAIISIYQIKNIVSSEIDARKLRYQAIIKHALLYKYSVIITAHTETDKIETFWQQITRGTSIDGATSLTYNRILNNHIKLLRPLINFTRIEITWFCRKFCLPIWSDITNYEYEINRNRFRNEFIPYIKRYFDNNIDKHISSFLKISDIENEYIKQSAIKLYLISRHKSSLALNYLFIKKQHVALQARTIQIFFYHNFNKSLNQHILNEILIKMQIMNLTYIDILWQHVNIRIYHKWLYIY